MELLRFLRKEKFELYLNISSIFRRAFRTWVTLAGVLLLISWVLAGLFMDGEDDLKKHVPWLVVLGGGAGERLQLACRLFEQGHGLHGVVLTGEDLGGLSLNRVSYLRECGIPDALLSKWPDTANTFEEMSSLERFLATIPNSQAIVISDTLHMPRLRYLRERLALNGKIFFRQSQLDVQLTTGSFFRVTVFWFREPLAYIYYLFRY